MEQQISLLFRLVWGVQWLSTFWWALRETEGNHGKIILITFSVLSKHHSITLTLLKTKLEGWTLQLHDAINWYFNPFVPGFFFPSNFELWLKTGFHLLPTYRRGTHKKYFPFFFFLSRKLAMRCSNATLQETIR